MRADDFSILIATYGDDWWRTLAQTRALPSAKNQGCEVLVCHQTDGNLAGVRNHLAGQAAGKYLVFLDADDELELGYVAAMARTGRHGLLNPAVRFVIPGQRPKPPKMFRPKDLRSGNYLVIGTAMPRDLFLQAGGFDEKWRAYEDWALLWRVHALGAQITPVPHAIYKTHWRPDSRNNTVSDSKGLIAEIVADFDTWNAQKAAS